MSRFKFKSLKQKQGATVDAYMAVLKVLIHECGYNENMQNILLKDQFIFGVTVIKIQEHLLNEIGDDHDVNQCLHEARKIKSHIVQRKLLGLKSVQYDAISRGRSKKKSKSKDTFRSKSRSQSGICDCRYVAVTINIDNAQLMGKHARVVAKRTILPKSVVIKKAKAKVLLVLRNPLGTERSM